MLLAVAVLLAGTVHARAVSSFPSAGNPEGTAGNPYPPGSAVTLRLSVPFALRAPGATPAPELTGAGPSEVRVSVPAGWANPGCGAVRQSGGDSGALATEVSSWRCEVLGTADSAVLRWFPDPAVAGSLYGPASAVQEFAFQLTTPRPAATTAYGALGSNGPGFGSVAGYPDGIPSDVSKAPNAPAEAPGTVTSGLVRVVAGETPPPTINPPPTTDQSAPVVTNPAPPPTDQSPPVITNPAPPPPDQSPPITTNAAPTTAGQTTTTTTDAPPGAAGGSGSGQQLTAVVPGAEPVFAISFASTPVFLTAGAPQTTFLPFTGTLLPISVMDTRVGGPRWDLSGTVGDFTGLAGSGRGVGWAPFVLDGAWVMSGSKIPSGFVDGGNGLRDSRQLASAPDGHPAGTAQVSADLDVRLPADIPGGTYSALITLTAI